MFRLVGGAGREFKIPLLSFKNTLNPVPRKKLFTLNNP
jgi:hypothetical protein